jgi:hypothetical protein
MNLINGIKNKLMERIIKTDEDIKDIIRRFVDYVRGCELTFDSINFIDYDGKYIELEQLLEEHFES